MCTKMVEKGILFTYSSTLATCPEVFRLLPVSRSLAASNACIICDQILRSSGVHSHRKTLNHQGHDPTPKATKIPHTYQAEFPNPILFCQVSTRKSLTFISSMIFKACSLIAAFAIALTTLPKLMVSGSSCLPCFSRFLPMGPGQHGPSLEQFFNHGPRKCSDQPTPRCSLSI